MEKVYGNLRYLYDMYPDVRNYVVDLRVLNKYKIDIHDVVFTIFTKLKLDQSFYPAHSLIGGRYVKGLVIKYKKATHPIIKGVLDTLHYANINYFNVGEIIIFCGRPGSGKTTEAKNMIKSFNSQGLPSMLLDSDQHLNDIFGNYIPRMSYKFSSEYSYNSILNVVKWGILCGINVVCALPLRRSSSLNFFKSIVKENNTVLTVVPVSNSFSDYQSITDKNSVHRISPDSSKNKDIKCSGNVYDFRPK
jgi:hypothetical protein